MEIEEEFGITIPDEAAETIHTVGDAIGYVESLEIEPAKPGIERPRSEDSGVPERRASYE